MFIARNSTLTVTLKMVTTYIKVHILRSLSFFVTVLACCSLWSWNCSDFRFDHSAWILCPSKCSWAVCSWLTFHVRVVLFSVWLYPKDLMVSPTSSASSEIIRSHWDLLSYTINPFNIPFGPTLFWTIVTHLPMPLVQWISHAKQHVSEPFAAYSHVVIQQQWNVYTEQYQLYHENTGKFYFFSAHANFKLKTRYLKLKFHA